MRALYYSPPPSPTPPTPQGCGCLVAMVHCDGTDSDEEEQLLRKHLLHICHLSLHVEGLSTGYSKDVHGNVSKISKLSIVAHVHSPLPAFASSCGMLKSRGTFVTQVLKCLMIRE